MKVMVLVKADRNTEAGIMPSTELLTEMGKFNEALVKAGMILAGEGLQPSSKGARVKFSGKKRTVIEGPFTDAKDLVAGFWMWDVKSMEDAIDWVKRCPNPTGANSEIEIRRVFEPDDFGDAYTPELREQEEHLRAKSEDKKKSKPAGAGDSKKIFVNLPVKSLDASVAFFTKLGYTFNPQFTDKNATCMIVSDTIYVMLLVEKYFKTFTSKPIADAKKNTETLVALTADSRDAVNRIVEAALAAGAKRHAEPRDHGFMYQWGFEDLDGHIWEHFWMDSVHIQK